MYERMCRRSLTALGALLVATLAGCSGGGGDSSSSGPSLVEITADDAQTVAGAVLASSLESGQLGAFAPTPAGTAQAKPAPQIYAKIASLKDAQTESLLKQSQAGYMQAAIGPTTSDCAAGGSVTVSGNLASETTLTVGDSVTVSFSACNDGTTVVDGTLVMHVTSLDGDLASGLVSLGLDLDVTDLQITQNGETATVNGSLSFLTDSTQSPTVTVTLTSDSLTVTGSGGASSTLSGFSLRQVSDADTLAYSLEISGTLTSSAFQGAAQFSTEVSLGGTGSGYAASGELLITGAHGATIRVVVLDGTNLRLDLDLDGDGQTDVSNNTTWADLT